MRRDEEEYARPAQPPDTSSLAAVREAAAHCTACHLYKRGTQTVFGPGFRVTRERGKVLSSKLAPRVLATVHPSSLLRQPDEESRQREYKHFVSDLRGALRAAGEE